MRLQLQLCLIAALTAAGAEWESLGPFGGSAAIVLVDPHFRDTELAATSNAQIFRSEDGGDSWKPLRFPAQFRATLHAFAVDRQNPGVYFVGLSSEIPEFSGVMRTTDSGLTWDRIPEPALRAVWSIAIWQRDSRVMAAGTEDGVFLTRDGGANWLPVTSADDAELKPVVALTFDPWDSSILYAGTPHLAWRTGDGGETWQPIHRGMLDDSDVFSILVDDRRRSRIFAATCGGIYRSLEGGAAWTKLAEAKGASVRTYYIAQDPLQPNILLAGTAQGLVKSVDSGATWRKVSALSTHWIAFDTARPNRLFIATEEAGLFRSDDDGESLQAINQGFSNRRFASLIAAQDALYVTTLTAGASSVLRRSDAEPEWKESPDLTPQSTQPETYALSEPIVNALSRLFPDGFWVHDVVPMENGHLLAATSHGLARSDDAGSTWRLVPGILNTSTVGALSQHPALAGIVFAARYQEVYRSEDGGDSWALLPVAENAPEDVAQLLVLPGDPDRLFALSASRGVYALTLSPE